MTNASVVAIGLLTRGDLDALGPAFERVWPVEGAPHFSQLLHAIDEADRQLQRVEETEQSRVTKNAER